MRYAPVLAMLRSESGTLLEVGSGSEGICQYLGRPVIGLEIRFPEPPNPLLRAVGGTATRLPFADRSIDVVLVMDTMEHIPAALREEALNEAMRVARRRIIVGGPMGPRARGGDERLAAFYRKHAIEVPDWLNEHLTERAPDVQAIAGPLRAGGWRVRARGNENLALHVWLMELETKRFFYRASSKLRRTWPRAASTIARALSVGPYYSWLVDARRDGSTRTTPGT